MALHTAHLAGEPWGIRTDVSEILARYGKKSSSEIQSPTCRTRGLGLLSRTIVQSPTIRWIIPARIRNQDRNDAIFVGESFIQIRELTSDGDLRYFVEMATKADFDAPIVCATAFSVRPEPALEDHIKLNAQNHDYDIEMTEGSDEKNLPPQILILVLASKEVVFLYAVENADGGLEFIHSRRPLPAEVGSHVRYGQNICVDPKSRAIAIMGGRKFFTILALESPNVLQSCMKRGELSPVVEEKSFRIDGEILHMDFLNPTAHDSDRVILVLLIAKDGETHITLYDWSYSHGLRSVTFKMVIRKLPQDCALPSILIPLKYAKSFLLVCASCMLVYKNILDSEGNRSAMILPLSDSDDKSMATEMLWSFWARPVRNRNRQDFDDLFLCRNDGQTLYLEIGSEGHISRQTEPGQLGCDVGTAFAIIDGGFDAGDLLLAFGSMGGGLFIADARQPPKCVQRFSNWAPVVDSVIVRTAPLVGNRGLGNELPANATYDRIFACTGTRQGSVTELRYGIEAQIGFLIDQDDASGVMDVWAIPNLQNGGIFLLLSDPMASSLIAISICTEDIYEADGASTGLDLEAPTLAVSTTPDGVTIQVTTVSVNLSDIGNETLRHSSRFNDPNVRIIAASTSGKSSLYAAAIRNAGDVRLEVWKVSVDEEGIEHRLVGKSIPLSPEQEPVCLALAQVGTGDAIFVGTTEGKVLMGTIGIGDSIFLSQQDIKLSEGNQDSTICESMTVITAADEGGLEYKLLCGLRSGNLVPFTLSGSQGHLSLELKQDTPRKLGDTPVRIRTYECDSSFAIASCNALLWRISHVKEGGLQRWGFEKIWFTDQNQPALAQSGVEVFTGVEPCSSEHPDNLGGSFICITKDQLLVCTLDGTAKPIPRHIQIPGTPRRMIYSDYLKRLVVGYSAAGAAPGFEHAQRATRFRIAFVDPDGDSARSSAIVIPDELDNPAGSPPQSQLPTGPSREKITSLLEWQFSFGDRVYHMIVIGTARPLVSQNGRLIYIVTRPSARDGLIDTTVKYVHSYDFPVRAIAAFPPSSLVIAVEDQVILQCLNPQTKRWRKFPPFRVESSVVSLTVKEPYIYVLTSKHSLVVLRADNDRLSLYGQAGTDRLGLDHVNLTDDSQITLVSSVGGCITGLTDMGLTPEEKLLRPLFIAHLPLTVLRLDRSFRPTAPGFSQIAYGTTIDGTVYRFRILSKEEWLLLGFIQNLCLNDRAISPFGPRRRKAITDVDTARPGKPVAMHVNGDILDRLFQRGVSYLENLVKSDTIGDGKAASSGYVSPYGIAPMAGDTNEEKFQEYSHPVVGDFPNPYVAVMQWMGELIRPGL